MNRISFITTLLSFQSIFEFILQINICICKRYLMHSESEKIVTLDLMEIGYTKVSLLKYLWKIERRNLIFHVYLSWVHFQTLMECAHERILINELVGIYTSGILPRTQLVAVNMLYMALDRCRDMIHVTDDKYIIQVNVTIAIIENK